MQRRLFTYLLLLLSFGSYAQINSVIVVTKTPTTPVDSIASSNPDHYLCPGDKVQLTLVGGSLGTDAVWTWYEGGCTNGTSIGTGDTILVTPEDSVTTYYCTAVGGCNMPCASATLMWNPALCAPLPVHLLSFDAQLYQENKGLVTWQTVDEEAKTGYDLFKSTDAKNFVLLYHEDAKLVNGKNNYQYIDKNLMPGNNYYRLTIHYPNQSIAYSQVKTVYYAINEDVVRLYPNPTDGLVYFEFNAQEGEDVDVWVSSIVGQRFHNTQTIHTKLGKNVVSMNLSDLAQGAYLFHYQNSSGHVQNIKFVKTN